jgi:hypothetical protein
VQVVSSSGVASTSLNTLWDLNSAPVISNINALSLNGPFGNLETGIHKVDNNSTTGDVLLNALAIDRETSIVKYKFEWDSNGDGTLDASYEETAGNSTDGSFDGKHLANFDPKASNGSPDVRQIKLTVTDSMGLSASKSNYITIDEAPTNNLTTINPLTTNPSLNFAVGQSILFDSQSTDVNSIVATGVESYRTSVINSADGYMHLGKIGKYEFDFTDDGTWNPTYTETAPGYYFWTQGSNNSNYNELNFGIAPDKSFDGKTTYSFDTVGSQ